MATNLLDKMNEARKQLDDKKFFEGVQVVNSCMELFETQIGGEGKEILRDPLGFLNVFNTKLTGPDRDLLRQLFLLHGDLLAGLGAMKRAELEYSAAALLGDPDGAEIQQKRARLAAPQADKAKIPCTILTGFLGSGKTTLLNHILQKNHGKRIAVIENEFGEVGIDDGLVKGGSMAAEEYIVEMNNGCICCTVRGDLIAGLKKLAKRSLQSGKLLDGVLIETTGLADPGPVAQTFFADDYVQQNFVLDGILTLVDAKHVIQHLDEEKPEGVENEAVEQIAFADRILLNKCDLVTEETLVDVEKRIRAINATVPVRRTVESDVDMDYILGIQAFCLDKILEKEDGFLNDDQDHQHDERVNSVGIDIAGEVDNPKLQKWIAGLLNEKGVDIFRSKGILAVKGENQKFVFQAIHMLFKHSREGLWAPSEERRCKMIFIGKNLNREELTSGFLSCLSR